VESTRSFAVVCDAGPQPVGSGKFHPDRFWPLVSHYPGRNWTIFFTRGPSNTVRELYVIKIIPGTSLLAAFVV
jgi:hypothetical protein